MMSKEKALELFGKGYNCAQAVIGAYSEEFGLTEESAKAVATGFGGGIGQMQLTCGALAGAIMILGLKSYDAAQVVESKKHSYKKVQELMRRFEAKHGSTECIRLLGVNMRSPEGAEYLKEKGLHERLCGMYITDVCELLEELL